jgi:hypothetical protein
VRDRRRPGRRTWAPSCLARIVLVEDNLRPNQHIGAEEARALARIVESEEGSERSPTDIARQCRNRRIPSFVRRR